MSTSFIGISRYYKKPTKPQDKIRWISVPIEAEQFDDSKLDTKTLDILFDIEARAMPNHGHTKFYNINLAKLHNIPIRTLQYHLKKLEKLGFITRHVDRKACYGARKGGYYSERVFQCNRILFLHRYRVKTKEEMGWKSDNRVIVKPWEHKVPFIFTIEREYIEYINNATKIKHVPFWRDYFELMIKGYMSGRWWDYYRRLMDQYEFGNERAKLIMGKFRRD